MIKPSYAIEHQNDKCVVIRDTGHSSGCMSVTNGAEAVVAELADALGDRKLYYYDSEGSLDELLVQDNRFAGFAPGPGDLNWN